FLPPRHEGTKRFLRKMCGFARRRSTFFARGLSFPRRGSSSILEKCGFCRRRSSSGIFDSPCFGTFSVVEWAGIVRVKLRRAGAGCRRIWGDLRRIFGGWGGGERRWGG